MNNQIVNLVTVLDAYFTLVGQHLNVNVIDKQTLINAQNKPNESLTIHISGYTVNFNRLTKELQDEVIMRTFHTKN